MHTSKAILAVAALLLVGCTDDSSAPSSDPTDGGTATAGPVALTPAERDDFLDRVTELGFTCRDALPDASTHVACTRPGSGPEASQDTIRLTASPQGDVRRVSYCGPDTEVGAAFSAAFLSEIGSPDLTDGVPRTSGTPLVACVTSSGTGFAAGARVSAPLPAPDLAALDERLTAAGWTCGDESSDKLDCTTGPGDARSLVSGVASELVAAAPDPATLASIATDLGLDQDVVDAAAACRAGAECDHLVVDAFDVTFDTDTEYARMRLRAAEWG